MFSLYGLQVFFSKELPVIFPNKLIKEKCFSRKVAWLFNLFSGRRGRLYLVASIFVFFEGQEINCELQLHKIFVHITPLSLIKLIKLNIFSIWFKSIKVQGIL